METLRIATRKSKLAVKQAETAAAAIRASQPELRLELVPLSTRGDRIQDRPLAAIGGKGLFLKELEKALLDGRADIAVHSMKDVPAELDPDFVLAAILPREDPFDAFISNRFTHFEDLPRGAALGSSSLRRQCQARALRPDLRVVNLRGNVNTRLGKLDAGTFDAIMLAGAGLRRLGLEHRIRQTLRPSQWIPAAGQGAIGIECLAANPATLSIVSGLQDKPTAACVHAERAVVRCLEGSCQVPIGAYARIADGTIYLEAMVGRPDGTSVLQERRHGGAGEAVELGEAVGAALLDRGGAAILHDLGAKGDG